MLGRIVDSLLVLAAAVGFAWVMLSPAPKAHAAPPLGIFAETTTKIDGVTVRRIRDTETATVCYVAIGRVAGSYGNEHPLPSISCVRGPQ